jgi:hypothetical protein
MGRRAPVGDTGRSLLAVGRPVLKATAGSQESGTGMA